MKKYSFLYIDYDNPGVIDDNPIMEWMLHFDEKEQLRTYLLTDSIENIIATLEDIFKETQPPYSFHLLPLLADFDVILTGNITLNNISRNDIIYINANISEEYHVNQLTLHFKEAINFQTQPLLHIKFGD